MSLEHRLHDRCACGSSQSSYAQASAGARPFALAGVARQYERARPFRIENIALDLKLDIPKKSIAGEAVLDIVRIDASATEIALDAVAFDIESVELREDGHESFAEAAFIYDGNTLRLSISATAARAAIRVQYRATPRRGLYFLAPDEHVRDRPNQVWSQCQDEDGRHVFPCFDKPHHKQSFSARIAAPTGWFVLSNGVKESCDDEECRGVFRYRMEDPTPAYLFSIVAGEFSRIDAEADGVAIHYFVPKGREADGARTFKRTPDMVRRFGQLTGIPYPWKSYSQIVVHDFIFGGMENTTATTMYEHILLDERATIDVTADDLIAHELAHHWFGDLVTCRDWSHAWLNEGFATFMEQIDKEGHLGLDEYENGVRGDLAAYLSEAQGRYRRPIVCQDYEAPIDIFDRHLYEKGACVLHLLRRELGDAAFWSGVSTYLKRHARGLVETRDLMRALEEASGKSLERFFEQWVFRAGHPDLEVKIDHDGEVLTMSVKQTHVTHHAKEDPQAAQPFAIDIDLDIVLADGSTQRETRRVDQAAATFAIRVPSRPKFVVVDSTLRILGEVKVECPRDMLHAQLAGAATARGRLLAASLLGKFDDPATTRVLAEALANENEFWAVRAEAAGTLAKIRSDEALDVLVKHSQTKHAKVRRAVAAALGQFRSSKAVDALKPLALKDDSYLVEAEAARALGQTKQSAAFDTLIDVLDRPSWSDIVRAGAIDGLAALRDERAQPHVLARTRYGIPTRGRRAAIMALPKLSTDRKVREALEDLLDQADPYLKVDVVRALLEVGDVKARAALSKQLERELDGRVRRRIREVLRDLGAAGKKETERLREELETLRNEHASLKARIGKLEELANGKKNPSSSNGTTTVEVKSESDDKSKKLKKKDVRTSR
ncbi:MAG: HEAT repeat domain-containing protein [Polyangiaceae bacterium]|nr:HEAT repeat domain-containing protein [Polyangiaceae bacterium]